MQVPRVALFGIFGRTNLGNEATFSAFLHHLKRRFPGARVACIGPTDSAVSRTFGVELIDMEPVQVRRFFWGFRTKLIRSFSTLAHWITEPLRHRRAKLQLRDFDLVLVPGTGILDDYGQTARDLPQHLLRWSSAARRASVPFYLVSVGAEVVGGSLTRSLFRRAAELSTYRSYRDDESRRNAALFGFSTMRDPVYPDLAFSLPDEALPTPRAVNWPPKRIGVGVMGYYGWNKHGAEGERIYQAYLEKMNRFVAWLLGLGYSVRLLVGDTRADDRPVRDLASAFRGNEHVIAEPIGNFDDLLCQLADTDVVVATRLHNVLLALLLERPTISISYSRKTDVLLEEFGLGAYAQEINALDVNTLIAQFNDLTSRPEPPVEAIRRRNREYRSLLEEQYDHIFSGLGSSGRT